MDIFSPMSPGNSFIEPDEFISLRLKYIDNCLDVNNHSLIVHNQLFQSIPSMSYRHLIDGEEDRGYWFLIGSATSRSMVDQVT